MSFTVLPSEGPGASSGSLLVIDTRIPGKGEPQASAAETVAVMGTIWWLAGFRIAGARLTEMEGAAVPAQAPA